MKAHSTVEMYAAIQVNGKIVHRMDDKVMLNQHIITFARWCSSNACESREISTVELLTSKRPIVDSPKTISDGIDMSLVTQATDEEEAAAEEYFRRIQDPLYKRWTELNSRNIQFCIPEEVTQIREHMRKHYPEINVGW